MVSALDEVGPGRFDADVSADWTIGDKPIGGYLLSVLGRAAVSTSRHPHVNAASALYLQAPQPGAVSVCAELLRAGRSTNQVRARLEQAGTVGVDALLAGLAVVRAVNRIEPCVPFSRGRLSDIVHRQACAGLQRRRFGWHWSTVQELVGPQGEQCAPLASRSP